MTTADQQTSQNRLKIKGQMFDLPIRIKTDNSERHLNSSTITQQQLNWWSFIKCSTRRNLRQGITQDANESLAKWI
jgi:hypothetical protein